MAKNDLELLVVLPSVASVQQKLKIHLKHSLQSYEKPCLKEKKRKKKTNPKRDRQTEGVVGGREGERMKERAESESKKERVSCPRVSE